MPDDPQVLEEPARRAFARRMAEAGGVGRSALRAGRPGGPARGLPAGAALAPDRPRPAQFHRSTDPADLYRDVLVALDIAKGINNGQPTLHAAGSAKCGRGPGETWCMSGGHGLLHGDPGGARGARRQGDRLRDRGRHWPRRRPQPAGHLAACRGQGRRRGRRHVPEADIIYVNAGVVAPPLGWLEALKPGGRLVFPWRPRPDVGVALLVTRPRPDFRRRRLLAGLVHPMHRGVGRQICPPGTDPEEVAPRRSLWLSRDRPSRRDRHRDLPRFLVFVRAARRIVAISAISSRKRAAGCYCPPINKRKSHGGRRTDQD
jgi:protein-L-isoaspartate(D-aspartate) O-methyltransferase